MTIDEAIRELGIINHDGFVIMRYTEFEALKLGIEALKRYQDLRSRNRIPTWERLTGETL